MRENLFRGKAINNGEYNGIWEEGDLHHNGDEARPMTLIGQVVMSRDKHTNELSFAGYCLVEVDPSTVGQYTGLTDANGQRIFEGDIVRCCIEEGMYVTAQVVFECGAFGLARIPELPLCFPNACNNDNFMSLWEIIWNAEELDGECVYMLEVIGNIHDNPELVEESER